MSVTNTLWKAKSPIFIAIGIFALAVGSGFFHYEVRWKNPECVVDLLDTPKGRCDLGLSEPEEVRVVAAIGPIRGGARIPISIQLESSSGQSALLTLWPKSQSVGASGPELLNNRNYKTSNYGFLRASPGEAMVISARGGDDLKLLRVEVRRDPRDWPIWIAHATCWIMMLLAVRYRQKTFLGKLVRWIPYTLIVFVGLLLFSWNL